MGQHTTPSDSNHERTALALYAATTVQEVAETLVAAVAAQAEQADLVVLARHPRSGSVVMAASRPGAPDLYAGAGAAPSWRADSERPVGQVDLHDTASLAPPLVRRMADLGLRSVRSTALEPLREHPVSLDVFAAGALPPALPDDVVTLLRLAGSVMRVLDRTENLRRALETRETIAQAQGVLMERLLITAEEAMGVLRRQSQHTHTRVVDVAAAVVAGQRIGPTDGPGTSSGRP